MEILQQQLAIVERFEILFDVNEPSALKKKLGTKDTAGTFLHFMRETAEQKYALAFNSPTTTSSTPPADNLAKAIARLKTFLEIKNPQESGLIAIFMRSEGPNAAIFRTLDSRQNSNRNVTFFNQVILALLDIDNHRDGSPGYKAIQELHLATRTLIQTQKNAVLQAIQAVQPVQPVEYEKSRKEAGLDPCLTPSNKASRAAMKIYLHRLKIKPKSKAPSAKLNRAHHLQATTAKKSIAEDRASASKRKTNLYLGASALATGGSAAIALSTLMQFGPQFAMLASLNLPPVALAAVAVSGVAMVAAAAYVAYRTCKLAPVVMKDEPETKENLGPVAATNYSKFLPHVLATMGTGMVGFSALMQFSPKVALFMGLNLTPAALLSVAAVGVLLLSASLYLACKACAKSRVDATAESIVATAATAEHDKLSCTQRLSQYTTCCFILFSRSTTAASSSTNSLNLGATLTA